MFNVFSCLITIPDLKTQTRRTFNKNLFKSVKKINVIDFKLNYYKLLN